MCNFQEYWKIGDDLHCCAKISHKGISSHDSSSLLCIYDHGGQSVAIFKGRMADAEQKSTSFFLSLARMNAVQWLLPSLGLSRFSLQVPTD